MVDRRSDFDPDARSKSLLKQVWNNANYRRARKSERRLPPETGQPLHLVKDGMSLSSIPAAEHELICERCPIPFRKDYVDRMLDGVGKETLATIRKGKNMRIRAHALAAYLLMGMPGRTRRAKPGAEGASGNSHD